LEKIEEIKEALRKENFVLYIGFEFDRDYSRDRIDKFVEGDNI